MFHVDLHESVFPFIPKYNSIFYTRFVARSEKDEEFYMVLQKSSLAVYYCNTQTLKQFIYHPLIAINIPLLLFLLFFFIIVQ